MDVSNDRGPLKPPFFTSYNYGIAGTLHDIYRDMPILADQIVTALQSASSSTAGGRHSHTQVP